MCGVDLPMFLMKSRENMDILMLPGMENCCLMELSESAEEAFLYFLYQQVFMHERGKNEVITTQAPVPLRMLSNGLWFCDLLTLVSLSTMHTDPLGSLCERK